MEENTESILHGKLLKKENINWEDNVEFILLVEHNCKFVIMNLGERDLDFVGDETFKTDCMAFEKRKDAEAFIDKRREEARKSFEAPQEEDSQDY